MSAEHLQSILQGESKVNFNKSTNRKQLKSSSQVPVKLAKLAMQARHVSSSHCLSHRLRWIEVDLTCSAMALAALLPCLQVDLQMGEDLQTKDVMKSSNKKQNL